MPVLHQSHIAHDFLEFHILVPGLFRSLLHRRFQASLFPRCELVNLLMPGRGENQVLSAKTVHSTATVSSAIDLASSLAAEINFFFDSSAEDHVSLVPCVPFLFVVFVLDCQLAWFGRICWIGDRKQELVMINSEPNTKCTHSTTHNHIRFSPSIRHNPQSQSVLSRIPTPPPPPTL